MADGAPAGCLAPGYHDSDEPFHPELSVFPAVLCIHEAGLDVVAGWGAQHLLSVGSELSALAALGKAKIPAVASTPAAAAREPNRLVIAQPPLFGSRSICVGGWGRSGSTSTAHCYTERTRMTTLGVRETFAASRFRAEFPGAHHPCGWPQWMPARSTAS